MSTRTQDGPAWIRSLIYGLIIGCLFYFGYEHLIAANVLQGAGDKGVAGVTFGFLAFLAGVFPEIVAGIYVVLMALVVAAWRMRIPAGDGVPLNEFRVAAAAFVFAPLALPFIAKLALGGYFNLFRRARS